MLAGLLFLGVLSAMSLPDMVDLWRQSSDNVDGGDEADEEIEQEQDAEPADPVDLASGPGSQVASPPSAFDMADGEDLFVDPAPGQTVVEAFNRGIDSLTIVLPDEAQEFAAHDAAEGQDAHLSYSTSEGAVQILFPGLASVPVDDIFLRVSDASSPTLDADIALSELLDESDEVLVAVLGPVDPTLPDELPLPQDPGAVVLDPVDPDLPDDPAPPLSPAGPVLTPVGDEPLPPGAARLAALIERDGGSATGLAQSTAAMSSATEGDDSLVLPAGGDPGTLGFSEAAPVLSGENVVGVDMGAGDDVLRLGDGAGYGFGGAGDDTLDAGPGAAALFGGAGNDLLTGDSGGGQSLLHGGSGDDTLVGGLAGSWLDGGEHGEAVDGPGGDDQITGGAGDDTIRGGLGADLLDGGAGNDVIDHRGTDATRITAERHEFAWHIDGAPDTLAGGAGDDTLIFDRGDVVTGGAGADALWLYADTGAAARPVADIADFTPGEDFLQISLNPQIVSPGEVEIVVSANGLDGLVQVGGMTVAILRGAPDATLADLFIETAEDVFPAGQAQSM